MAGGRAPPGGGRAVGERGSLAQIKILTSDPEVFADLSYMVGRGPVLRIDRKRFQVLRTRKLEAAQDEYQWEAEAIEYPAEELRAR